MTLSVVERIVAELEAKGLATEAVLAELPTIVARVGRAIQAREHVQSMGDMSYGEFRKWALANHGIRLSHVGDGAFQNALWPDGGAGTGTGHPASYGVRERRRLVCWVRIRGLIEKMRHREWLDEAEYHDTGWLVNDGSGVRWVADPTSESTELILRGFVAIRLGPPDCGK